MKYVGERKYDGMDRIGFVVLFSVVWGLIGTGKTSVLGEIFWNLWLGFCAEFSFEYHEGKLKIRAAGHRWILDGWLRFVVWPFGWPLSILGVKNCPILAILMTAFHIYVILAGFQLLDNLVHIALIWILYHMRKVDK